MCKGVFKSSVYKMDGKKLCLLFLTYFSFKTGLLGHLQAITREQNDVMIYMYLLTVTTKGLTELSIYIGSSEKCYFYDYATSFYGYYGYCESGCCGSPDSQWCCNEKETESTSLLCVGAGAVVGLVLLAIVVYGVWKCRVCNKSEDSTKVEKDSTKSVEVDMTPLNSNDVLNKQT